MSTFAATRGSSFWAGASDQDEEGTWKWVNSNATIDCDQDFCDWNSGEPSGGEQENCLQVFNDYYWDTNHWNDASCDTLTHYICEKPFAGDFRKTTWIGLKDVENTGTLSWTDGTPVTFTKWQVSQT